jgi:NuA3 HAT complex component NTO1
VDIKERRKLGKRIIKAIQPQLETALRAEADISGIDFDKELKKIENLWEACLEVEPEPQQDTEGDLPMTDISHAKNDLGHTNGDSASEIHGGELVQSHEAGDIEMGDIDAPYDEEDIIVDVAPGLLEDIKSDGDTITTAALAEVNGNRSPAKVNGLKNTDQLADTNGHAPAPENGPLGALASPISNGNDNAPLDNTLTEGGVPQFLRAYFNIDGTDITEIVREEPRASEELSEMDEDEVNELIAEPKRIVVEPPPPPPAAKSKKGKSKKRR